MLKSFKHKIDYYFLALLKCFIGFISTFVGILQTFKYQKIIKLQNEVKNVSEKIILRDIMPSSLNPDSKELANIIINRIGLMPRKKGSTENMYKVLIELYEKTKRANQNKRPEMGIMTVEEMGNFAGITRQTMYEYLSRWTEIDLIVKTSYIWEGKVIIGYKLNGNTLETAFDRIFVKVKNSLDMTKKFVKELQKSLKNEKLSQHQKMRHSGFVA